MEDERNKKIIGKDDTRFLRSVNLNEAISNKKLRDKLSKKVDRKILNRRFEKLKEVGS